MSKHAVILYTIGSPEHLDPACIRDYINRFLSDKLVVKLPRFLWQPILQKMILKNRPQRLVGRYSKIFVEGKNPYLRDMEQLCSDLQIMLNDGRAAMAADAGTASAGGSTAATAPAAAAARGQAAGADAGAGYAARWDYVVVPAYAYTGEGLTGIARELLSHGISNITVIPLFPQYSDTTSKRPRLELEELKKSHPEANFSIVRSYCDHELYIRSVADLAAPALADPRSHLLLTYHSLPKSYITLGDPYLKECRATSEAVFRRLGLDDSRSSISFQSKMGPMPWLKPYLEEHVDELINRGVTRLVVMAPGFSTDCLETLYDIDLNLREQFMNHGGESFTYVPCLNATAAQSCLMADLLKNHSRPV